MYELISAPLFRATCETLYMVLISGLLSIVFGLGLGTFLFLSTHKQALANSFIQRSVGLMVNVTRSIPFIILMISVIPLTRLLIGTTIGTNAAIVPLTLAAIPFFARVSESALAEVPFGLIETAHAMGASTSQIVSKILIPESLPSLIRGATLTLIGLVGYSAMAGVVGGGGLGELAINYGYQRFNVFVMLETVIILIILVQLIQMLGDKLAKQRRVKHVVLTSISVAAICIVAQLWPAHFQQENIIRVGVMTGWPEEVMHVAQDVARKNYGINLEVITFTDYVQPNTALVNKSIDANIFQHEPYLAGQVQARHYHLRTIAKTFVYPMGFYSQKITTLNQLANGALVALPNDPSNGGRALMLLQKAGLIKLKPGVGIYGTIYDIIANKKHLQFKLLDAAQLPRVLKDADLVAITNDFLGPAGLTNKPAILREASDSPYANIIVVREQDKDNAMWDKLIAIMHSNEVVARTKAIFPNGAAIPAWN